MAELIHRHWQPADQSGLVAADRRGGRYSAYVPDMLCGRPLALDGALGASAAAAERAIRASVLPGSRGLAAISRLLTRSGHLQFDDQHASHRRRRWRSPNWARPTEKVRGLSDKAKLDRKQHRRPAHSVR